MVVLVQRGAEVLLGALVRPHKPGGVLIVQVVQVELGHEVHAVIDSIVVLNALDFLEVDYVGRVVLYADLVHQPLYGFNLALAGLLLVLYSFLIDESWLEHGLVALFEQGFDLRLVLLRDWLSVRFGDIRLALLIQL